MPVAKTVVMTAVIALAWQPGARAADKNPGGTQVDTEPSTDAKPASAAPADAPPPAAARDDETPRPANADDIGARAPSADEGGAPVTATALAAPAAPAPSPYSWGVGLRGRFVSVPGWLLGLFTAHNHPLLTFGHFGVEAFRRGGNFDLAVSFSYQNMSPPDGNWLGRGHDPAFDTKWLQFRNLSIYSADVSFIWHSMLSSWFGVHLGAGLGLAVVRGDLFLFQSDGCNAGNLDNLSQCHPMNFTCANGVCNPPPNVARIANNDVLPVVPIVNIALGVDFRLPNVKGWEAKLEGGFYDAFFFGFGVAYTF